MRINIFLYVTYILIYIQNFKTVEKTDRQTNKQTKQDELKIAYAHKWEKDKHGDLKEQELTGSVIEGSSPGNVFDCTRVSIHLLWYRTISTQQERLSVSLLMTQWIHSHG
jgi:hypothetical protein